MTSSMVFSHFDGWDGGIRNHDDGVKVRCLTTWLHPSLNELNSISHTWFTSYIDSPWQEIVASEYKYA